MSNLAEMCSKAQEISLNITTDLLRFLHQLQITPSVESYRGLEDRAARMQEFRNHNDSSFLNLADLCSRIHTMAPGADGECSKMLANLHSVPPNGVAALSDKEPVFDKCLNDQRENTVEYFSLKAEIDIVNREIGQLIADFRHVLLAIDTSEPASSHMHETPFSL